MYISQPAVAVSMDVFPIGTQVQLRVFVGLERLRLVYVGGRLRVYVCVFSPRPPRFELPILLYNSTACAKLESSSTASDLFAT